VGDKEVQIERHGGQGVPSLDVAYGAMVATQSLVEVRGRGKALTWHGNGVLTLRGV
jgi:hypothetical protein